MREDSIAQMRTNKEKGGKVLESTHQKEAATQLCCKEIPFQRRSTALSALSLEPLEPGNRLAHTQQEQCYSAVLTTQSTAIQKDKKDPEGLKTFITGPHPRCTKIQ